MLSSSGLYAQTTPIKSRLPQNLSTTSPSKQINARQARYSPKESKVAPELWGLYQEYEQATRGSWEAYVEEQAYDETLILYQEKVVIEAVAEQNTEALRTTLEQLGLERSAAFGRMVSGLFPISRIDELEAVTSLRFARPSYRPVTKVGAVTSQGDAAQGTDLARNVCNLDGSGTTVGIMSDSYDALGGAAEGIESGDLPGPGNPNGNFNPTIILSDIPFGIDEGRAMAEIIYDVAPEATLAYHTAFLGQADFASGIIELAEDAGSDVIVDDIGYLTDPFFQDGIVAQAVDQVEEAGVTYLSAAGNDARQSYESEFRPTEGVVKLTDANGDPIGDYILHDFDPGPGVDNFQRITIPGATTISFQWSQPYASICPTSPGAASDLDILIFTREGDFSSAIFGGLAPNIGGDPLEFLSVGTDFATEAYIVIGKFVGVPEVDFEVPGPNPNPERIKYIYFGGELQEEYATNSGTVFGHPNAAGAIAVGAVPYFNTPAFGEPEPLIEPFSSAGGVPILLTPCGEPIEPVVRQKPEVSGPDGGNNTFFGGDVEGDGFPNFFGTSASSPHVAGLAALMKQAAADLSPDSIESILQSTALDMDDPRTPGPDPGFDFGTGFGFVRAIDALSTVSDCVGLARLELYNADTDELVTILNDGDRISSQTTGSTNLAIRAITIPDKVGSVVIEISGSLNSRQVENIPPYASFGDGNTGLDSIDFNGREFTFGSFEEETYTVTATAYREARAQGDIIGSLSLSFVLVDELLTGFSLIDAGTRQVIIPSLQDFQIVNLSQTGTNLNVRAQAGNEDAVGSVEFILQETDITVTPTDSLLRRTENVPPFTLFNDTEELDGRLDERFYLLTATPYSEDNLQGIPGPTITLIFAVSDDGGLPNATAPAETPLVVYPNPLDNQSSLRVSGGTSGATAAPTTFRLLNQQGEEVHRQQANQLNPTEPYQIDVQSLNLSPGMYFLRVERADAAPQVVRVMKE